MNKLKKIILIPFLLVVVSVVAQNKGYKINEKVTDFSLKNIDGEMVSLNSDKNAKGYIVVFTCNHCPYAKLYEDRIIALDKKYRSKNYPVLAINPNDVKKQPDDSYEKMQERAKEKGFTFPYVLDESQEVAKAFGATRTPHVYILQKEGADFVLKYIGAIDDNPQNANDVEEKFVENALEALISNKKDFKKETRAIGCTIKWK